MTQAATIGRTGAAGRTCHLPLIIAMIKPYDGAITIADDQDGPGKTVHVTITLTTSGDSP